jgi:hypothetical protein
MRETHHNSGDHWVPGDYWIVCDECGLDYRKSDTRKRWDNAIVCADCWEPRHPQEFIKSVRDNQRVPVARPSNAVTSTNTTTQDDL